MKAKKHLPEQVVADLDGTLLPADKRLTRRTVDAVGKLQRAGVGFTLATGKLYPLADSYAREMGLETPLIAVDGALVRGPDGGAVVHHTPLPAQVVTDILSACHGAAKVAFADRFGEEMLVRPRGWRRW